DRGIIDNLLRIFNNEMVQETINFRFLDANGKYHYIEAAITDLRTTPEIGGLVLNCQDVTETTILQQEIQYRIAFEQVLLNIATTLITTPENELINHLKTNFAMIGKLMNPDDYLRNLNLTANYLLFSVLDPSTNYLKSLAHWSNLSPGSLLLEGFHSFSLDNQSWLKNPINQNEPVFFSSISDMVPILAGSLREELKKMKEGAFLAVPFRSNEYNFSGALIIFFQTAINPAMKDRFLDLFQKLTTIMKSHLERISLSFFSSPTEASSKSIIELIQESSADE
ncbi:MAG: hypothetical protein ACTSUK_06300, partial [Promethearchaeota archaeon]